MHWKMAIIQSECKAMGNVLLELTLTIQFMDHNRVVLHWEVHGQIRYIRLTIARALWDFFQVLILLFIKDVFQTTIMQEYSQHKLQKRLLIIQSMIADIRHYYMAQIHLQCLITGSVGFVKDANIIWMEMGQLQIVSIVWAEL